MVGHIMAHRILDLTCKVRFICGYRNTSVATRRIMPFGRFKHRLRESSTSDWLGVSDICGERDSNDWIDFGVNPIGSI
jgi:hypothetical protein